jgi:hypothetical protein
MTARTHSPLVRIVPFLLAVCLSNLPAQAKYSGGSGTADDPYQIATAADLIALGETPADYDKHFVLTADIDLDPNLPGRKVFDKAVIAPGVFSYSRISPYEIGHSGTPFAGVLDGKGHTVRHLMARIGQATTGGTVLGGLFGMLHGEVRNLGVEDVNITGSGCPVGGLVAESEGTVADCYSSGAVSGMRHVGGLTGANYGSVAQCHSMGTVNGNSRVGGLVGLNGSWDTPGVSVSQCYSTAVVNGKEEVGGLVGENGGAVTECYSSGAVSGTDAVGGLVGQNWMGVEIVTSGSIEKSHSSAVVEGTTSVGGLVGDNPGTVTQSYSTGAVSGTGQDSYGIGGLVGSNWWFGATVMQCYSTGAVSGSDQGSTGVGGLVGGGPGTVIQCYSTGAVTGPDGATGGLVGYAPQGAVTACFWDTQTSGQATSAGGTGRITTEMQTAKTFVDAGWDFVGETKNGTEDIWWIDEGKDYPRLWWELGERESALRTALTEAGGRTTLYAN